MNYHFAMSLSSKNMYNLQA